MTDKLTETKGAAIQTTAFEALACNPDCDVEKLERIMALWERDQAAKAKREYYEAMNRTQAEIRPVVRDAANTHTRTQYTRLETMHKAIAPVYTANGFSISHDEADGAPEGMTRYIAVCRHIGGHSETFRIDLPLDDTGAQGSRNKTGVHAKASSSSYARRYLEARIFNVVFGGEDDDGNAAGGAKTITDEEAMNLRDLIQESQTDRKKFLQWAGTDSVDAFPAAKYAEACRILKGRINK